METNPYQPPISEPEHTVADSTTADSHAVHPAMWLVVVLASFIGIGMMIEGVLLLTVAGGAIAMAAIIWMAFLASKSV